MSSVMLFELSGHKMISLWVKYLFTLCSCNNKKVFNVSFCCGYVNNKEVKLESMLYLWEIQLDDKVNKSYEMKYIQFYPNLFFIIVFEQGNRLIH